MSRIIVLATVAACAAFSASAQQATIVGTGVAMPQLMRVCAPQQREDHACLLYISGVLDTHRDITALRLMTPLFCLPRGFTYAKAEDIFYAWGQKHAEEYKNDTASIAVISAFRDTYPCPKTPPAPKSR